MRIYSSKGVSFEGFVMGGLEENNQKGKVEAASRFREFFFWTRLRC